MSMPLAQSHVCARHCLPQQVRCSAFQNQAASRHQRLYAKQRSLSSCNALRGQHLSGRSLQSRKRNPAVVRRAKDDDDDEDEEEEDGEEEGDEREGRGGRADAEDTMIDEEDDGFQERVVQVRRVTKVAKGGKSMSFRAVVIVGDEMGQVGVGCATGKEVVTAVSKAVVQAKMEIIKVPLTSSATFPHKFDGYAGSAKVMLRPASEGTGVIAGGAVRVVLELAGVRNAFGKQLGSQNPLNNARATIAGLSEMRTFKDIAKTRGLSPQEILSQMTVGRRTTSSTAAAEKYVSKDDENEIIPAADTVPDQQKSKYDQLDGPVRPLQKQNLDDEWKELLSEREDRELADAWSKL